MNFQKFLLAAVLSFIVMFVLSFLGHMVIMEAILGPSPMAPVERESPLMLGIALAYLFLALLMSYMYPKGVEEGSKFGNGARFGMLIGLIIALPISLILYSILQDATISIVITETIWHVIEQGCGGVVIAYVYGLPASAPVAKPV